MSVAPSVLVPQHFGALLFERGTSRYLPFDHEAAGFLRELKSRPLGELLDPTHADERDAQTAFVASLERRGHFTADGRFAGTVLDATPPARHLLGPLAVHLEVVGACNLACSHCFASPLPRNHDPLTLPELERLFDELAALGSFRLGLTGGEPLLRRDLLDVIDAATGRGLHPCLTVSFRQACVNQTQPDA